MATVSSAPLYSSRQPLAQQTNGTYRTTQSRTDTSDFPLSNSTYNQDAGYLAPSRAHALARQHSDISAAESEPDSLLELYRAQTESRNASGNLHNGEGWGISGARGIPDEMNDSHWIHRDKLAQIESRELEEAGFRVSRVNSAAGSRSASASRKRRESNDHYEYGGNGEERGRNLPMTREAKRQQWISPMSAREEREDTPDFELHTMEEVASDKENQTPQSHQHLIRPSTSRIPVAKSSPVPIPHTYIERDSPLPRSRAGSGTWNGLSENGSTFIKGHRARNSSGGSHVLMYDPRGRAGNETPTRNSMSDAGTPQMSPPKAKAPTKAPTSGARKTTTPGRNVSGAKPRAASTTHRESPRGRPGTSNSTTRPSTSHNRPEGEAPWIATMYKPDPRLPPEEQILPTHAKRMAQQQWEKEGKTGSVYDREFNLLTPEEFTRSESRSPSGGPMPPEKQQSAEFKQAADQPQWPLPSPKMQSNGTFGNSGSEHGGYSTIPRIQTPPQPPLSPRPAVSPARQESSRREPIRVQEPREDKEKKAKKSCGCCIVM